MAPPNSDAPDGDRLLKQLRDALEPDGWSVQLVRQSKTWRFVFSHPLSGEWGFMVDPAQDLGTADKVAEHIGRLLKNREFRMIAEGPKTVRFPRLLQKLRSGSRTFEWTPELLDRITQVMVWAELLTPEESAWVIKAGAPLGGWEWQERHKRKPPVGS